MARRPQNQMLRLSALRQVTEATAPYDYLDLGTYLTHVFGESKAIIGHYSYKEFSLDLGLGLGNSSWLMIHGKRQPTAQSLDRMAQALGLSGLKRKAFLLLAKYSAESSPALKEQILSQMLLLKRQSLTDDQSQLELDFYREWYHAIIFEMVGLPHFSSDPAWIVSHINASISEKEAKDSLEMLEKLGCIRFDPEQGRHVKVMQDFESKSEVPGVGIIRFHQKMIDLGKESIETVAFTDREIGAVTVGVSAAGMEVIKKSIQSFRKYLMFLAADYGGDADTVLQLNIQMFPIATASDEENNPTKQLKDRG